MNKPIYSAMSPQAVLEIVESIQAITLKHHGEVEGCLLQVDYAAAAMFALMDMATAGQDAEGKRAAYDRLLGSLGRMASRVESDGVAGIMGGVVRSDN